MKKVKHEHVKHALRLAIMETADVDGPDRLDLLTSSFLEHVQTAGWQIKGPRAPKGRRRKRKTCDYCDRGVPHRSCT